MRMKHWLIGLVAVLALAVGVGGGTALAQEEGEEGETTIRGVIARVATILGLEEQQVQDAFDQARQEMRDEVLEQQISERLETLVESGRLTQEQADELREWYAARPDSFWLADGSRRGMQGGWDHGRSFGGRGHYSSKGQMGMSFAVGEERLGQYLDALVEDGQITQEQADEIRKQSGAQLRDFRFGGDNDRGRGYGRQRGHMPSIQKGFFNFRGFSIDKDESVPATPTIAPAATPTTPADSSDSN